MKLVLAAAVSSDHVGIYKSDVAVTITVKTEMWATFVELTVKVLLADCQVSQVGLPILPPDEFLYVKLNVAEPQESISVESAGVV